VVVWGVVLDESAVAVSSSRELPRPRLGLWFPVEQCTVSTCEPGTGGDSPGNRVVEF
jgi:hypothetical protein